MSSLSPSLSSSVSVESGMPSLSQSAGGGGAVGTVPGPVGFSGVPAGRMIGDFDFGVFLLNLPERTYSWKRVGDGSPFTIVRKSVIEAGTTTVMRRVLLAVDGRART